MDIGATLAGHSSISRMIERDEESVPFRPPRVQRRGNIH